MMLNFRVPPSSVSFRLLFEEFCRAYPLGIDQLRKETFPNDATRAAFEYLAQKLEQSHPSAMLQFFQERLQTVDHARIILARDDREPLEVSPEILDGLDREAARYGICSFHPLAVKQFSVGRDYQLATMYLPLDVAEALRQTWPRRPVAHQVPPSAPDLEARRSQGETLSEGRAVRIIIAAVERGDVTKKEDARRIIDGRLGVKAFERVCTEVGKTHPWKRGAPKKSG